MKGGLLAVAVCVGLAALVSCEGDPPPQSSPRRPAAGLIGPVGPADRPCRGVPVAVGEDVARVLDAHPPGTTYCLARGVHRIAEPLAPQRGDRIIGRRGAVLDGSKVLTGWRRAGDVWVTDAFLPAFPDVQGVCLESAPRCDYPEDVFLDRRRLDRVGSRDRVTAGTFYADYRANTVTVGDDPRAHLLEQAVAPSLVWATVDDVTVANLVLEQAANSAQVGAVEARRIAPHAAGSGWRVIGNEVRLNHGVGIGLAGGSTVRDNQVHHQGQLGFGAWGVGARVTNNEIAHNGVAGYSQDWEAGGAKSWMTEDLTVDHNFIHHNRGPGLWFDGGNLHVTCSANRIVGNWGAGIQYELSYDARILDNHVVGNGRRHKGWAWEAGIQIQSSGGDEVIEVAHNVVADNANGIMLIDSGGRRWDTPAPHGPHDVENVWVHDNTVVLREGQLSGAVEDIGNPAIFDENGNRFERNTYYLDSLVAPHFSWGGDDLGWDEWRSLGNGNDLTGRADVVASMNRPTTP